jgi:hypothetical protein
MVCCRCPKCRQNSPGVSLFDWDEKAEGPMPDELVKIQKTLWKCALLLLNNYQVFFVWTCTMHEMCQRFELTSEKLMEWVYDACCRFLYFHILF